MVKVLFTHYKYCQERMYIEARQHGHCEINVHRKRGHAMNQDCAILEEVSGYKHTCICDMYSDDTA